jgi:glycosyltransferase involved in cell wall biosynthesis
MLRDLGFEASWHPYEKPSASTIPEFLYSILDTTRKLAHVHRSPKDTGVMVQRYITEYSPWTRLKHVSSAFRYMPTCQSIIFAFFSKFVFKKRFIYDIDDALFLNRPIEVPLLLRVADDVIVGGHNLRKYAIKYNRKLSLLPTSVDVDKYPRERKSATGQTPRLGFLGSPSTTVYISEVLAPIKRLAESYDFDLIIASAPSSEGYRLYSFLFQKLRKAGVKVQLLRWSLENEVDILRNIDIGLAPLSRTDWDSYKCGFKVINYMAACVPPVASAVGEHNFIINDGMNGFLCRNDREWTMKLRRLIEDTELRTVMANNARRTAEQKYSLQKNVEYLATLLRMDDK